MSFYLHIINQIISNIKERMIAGITFPLIVNIPITYKCNLSCRTCNLWKLYKVNPTLEKYELTAPEWIDFFEKTEKYFFMLVIGGGEFILKKEIDIILNYIVKDTTIPKITLITNGYEREKSYKLIEELVKSAPSWKLLRLNISCDGLEPTHNFIRGNKEAFSRCISLFEELRGISYRYKNFQVALSYTISVHNIGKLEEFWKGMREAITLLPEELCFNFEHYTYGFRIENKDYSEMYLDRLSSDIEVALKIIKTRKNKNILDRLRWQGESYYLKKILDFVKNREKMIIPCISPGRFSLYVEPDGNICPCGHWGYSLGNIKDDFKKTFSSTKMRALTKIIKQGECPICWGLCEFPQNWLFNGGFIRNWR